MAAKDEDVESQKAVINYSFTKFMNSPKARWRYLKLILGAQNRRLTLVAVAGRSTHQGEQASRVSSLKLLNYTEYPIFNTYLKLLLNLLKNITNHPSDSITYTIKWW